MTLILFTLESMNKISSMSLRSSLPRLPIHFQSPLLGNSCPSILCSFLEIFFLYTSHELRIIEPEKIILVSTCILYSAQQAKSTFTKRKINLLVVARDKYDVVQTALTLFESTPVWLCWWHDISTPFGTLLVYHIRWTLQGHKNKLWTQLTALPKGPKGANLVVGLTNEGTTKWKILSTSSSISEKKNQSNESCKIANTVNTRV